MLACSCKWWLCAFYKFMCLLMLAFNMSAHTHLQPLPSFSICICQFYRAMWAVSDIVLELQSSGRLLAGKDECDPFAAALVHGLCAEIKGLEGFNALHAVEIKTAAETALPMVFQTSVGKAIEESPFGYTNMWEAFHCTASDFGRDSELFDTQWLVGPWRYQFLPDQKAKHTCT